MPALVYVISGFLGSGKTTFINSILESAPSSTRITVLVNDVSNIAIDTRLIKTDPENIVDLSGGCICCGLSLELIASMRFVLETHSPDIILIESTGLAIPREIARQAASAFFEGQVALGGIITLIDAAGMDFEKYPLILEQLQEANVVVLNKVDLVDPQKLPFVRDKIRRLMGSGTTLYETSFGRIQYYEILPKIYCGAEDSQRMESGRIDTTAGFSSICLKSRSPVRIEELIRLYKTHADKIVRSKGFVLTERGPVELQFSVDGLEVKDAVKPVDRTELVLIVRTEDRDLIDLEFKQLFHTH
jgi:G3E family GTPase